MVKQKTSKEPLAPKEQTNDWLVNPFDVLEVDPKTMAVALGGTPVTAVEIKNLKGEIKTLANFRIWRIMQETIRQKAIEKAMLHSTDWEQVLAGKMMIHNLGILKSIMHAIDTL